MNSTVICFRKLSTSKWEKSVKQTKMERRKKALRWLDREGKCFKKGVVMEEVSSCPRQEKCRTDEPSKQQEQARSGNSDEEFQVEIMPSSKTSLEVPRLPRRF